MLGKDNEGQSRRKSKRLEAKNTVVEVIEAQPEDENKTKSKHNKQG